MIYRADESVTDSGSSGTVRAEFSPVKSQRVS